MKLSRKLIPRWQSLPPSNILCQCCTGGCVTTLPPSPLAFPPFLWSRKVSGKKHSLLFKIKRCFLGRNARIIFPLVPSHLIARLGSMQITVFATARNCRREQIFAMVSKREILRSTPRAFQAIIANINTRHMDALLWIYGSKCCVYVIHILKSFSQ